MLMSDSFGLPEPVAAAFTIPGIALRPQANVVPAVLLVGV
jgi:hypothetical protein